ncbi:hypothetical protein [Flavobacterium sp. NRK F7]|uniref:hypothetical protein n=1 Tax=Flavobacterium sp. NRK F7 TaxID=2954930 RepID=UPI0020918225|nr:hypothetical protein [Flavobacterium sp. NRK F7]MCO6163694.1 hypothetical protein [Flavobacterium sp. NRK F7]
MKYIRKIIEVLTRLGFIYFPAKAKHLLTKENCSLQVVNKYMGITILELNIKYNNSTF